VDVEREESDGGFIYSCLWPRSGEWIGATGLYKCPTRMLVYSYQETERGGSPMDTNATWTDDSGRQHRVLAGPADRGFAIVTGQGGWMACLPEAQLTRDGNQ
jgi:hypothetical protein